MMCWNPCFKHSNLLAIFLIRLRRCLVARTQETRMDFTQRNKARRKKPLEFRLLRNIFKSPTGKKWTLKRLKKAMAQQAQVAPLRKGWDTTPGDGKIAWRQTPSKDVKYFTRPEGKR